MFTSFDWALHYSYTIVINNWLKIVTFTCPHIDWTKRGTKKIESPAPILRKRKHLKQLIWGLCLVLWLSGGLFNWCQQHLELKAWLVLLQEKRGLLGWISLQEELQEGEQQRACKATRGSEWAEGMWFVPKERVAILSG